MIDRSVQDGSSASSLQNDVDSDAVLPEVPPKTIESLEASTSDVVLPVSLGASGTIIIGSVSAPHLRIVTDPSCVYCQEFTIGDQVWLEQSYVAGGRLALEIIYLPMNAIGVLNAKALLCSQQQDFFTTMEQAIAVDPVQTEAELIARIKALHLQSVRFTTCLRSKETTSILDDHRAIAEDMHVSRVPSFSIGNEAWLGIESRSTLQRIIDRALESL